MNTLFTKKLVGTIGQISTLEDTVSVTYVVGWWPEFLATDLEVPGSIPGATRFSEKY
jgi:hypothetical protein